MEKMGVDAVIKVMETKSYIFIVVVLIVWLTPTIKNWIEMRGGAHVVKKDRQAAFFLALNNYLTNAPGYAPEFLNYQLEQTFEQSYKRRLFHYEIKKLLDAIDPSDSIRRYLRSKPYLELKIKNGVPDKFRFKEKPQRYKFKFRGRRLYKTSVDYLTIYVIFGVGGGFFFFTLITSEMGRGDFLNETFLWRLSLAIGAILVAIGHLIAEAKFDSARRFLLKKSPPFLPKIKYADGATKNHESTIDLLD